jgi:hypothetical protein
MGSGRVTLHGEAFGHSLLNPAHHLLRVLKGQPPLRVTFSLEGLQEKPSDASKGCSSLRSTTMRSLPRIGSDILYPINIK